MDLLDQRADGALRPGHELFAARRPEYIQSERRELKSKCINFDYVGLGLIILAMSAMEVVLSKGQEWDWTHDPYWRVQGLLFVLSVGLVRDRDLGVEAPGPDPQPGTVP